MIPLSDANYRPLQLSLIPAAVIAINLVLLLPEVIGGDVFIKQWSLVSARARSGPTSPTNTSP